MVYIFLYNIFLRLYLGVISLAALWNIKARNWITGRKDLMEQVKSSIKGGKPVIWMHCASLGEFEQGRPVLEQLKSQFTDHEIVLTFFSPSGYMVQKNYRGADYIFYLPLGTRKAAQTFINLINPKLVVWVKYEYWYHFLHQLHEQKIPVILISAIFRKDQVFFKWYGSLHRKMLTFFDRLFVQNESSAQLLRDIGIRNVTIAGDTRFDRVVDIANTPRELPIIAQFCQGRIVIVAGSTWPEDEEALDHYANTHPELRFIIAPHEIDDDHLEEIEKLFSNTVRYSKLEAEANLEADINTAFSSGTKYQTMIIDNIGMLSKLYSYSTISYVGGGFGDDGIHNILEAAVYGKPVLFGPEYEKYKEANDLVEMGGAFSAENVLELEELLTRLLKNEDEYREASATAMKYVQDNTGATNKLLDYIQTQDLRKNEVLKTSNNNVIG